MNPTVLLVDDLQMFLDIERDFFSHAEVRIVTARDGVEALEAVKAARPDLVFMDLQMPRMDGASCCKAIKSDPDHRHIPVVIISASKDENDRQASLAAGCNYFLTKPAGRERFLEIAREFIPGLDRRESRVPCSVSASIHFDGRTLPCSLYDLGAEGAFVATDCCVPPGNVVNLSFVLPDGTRIDTPCKIVWASEKNGRRPKGLGLRFALMARETKSSLARHVARLAKG